MRPSIFLGIVLCVGCATTPSDRSSQSTPQREDVAKRVDARDAAVEECYTDYVKTFGGEVGDATEMAPAAEGPTLYTQAPWQGELVFQVEVEASTAEVSLASSSSVGDTDASEPPTALVACVSAQLESLEWPAGRYELVRPYRFRTTD